MALKRNVLIFHSGALGDFVLGWPLVMALARVFAQSRVFVVTHRQKGLLAEKALRVESLDADAGGWHALFAEGGAAGLPDQAKRLLAGSHAIAGFVADANSPWAKNVRDLSAGADVALLGAHPPASFAGHHTDFLVQQLAGQVIWQQGVVQMLASVKQRGLGFASDPAGPVVIHPGAGSPTKCWLIDRYRDLAVQLRDAGRKPVFVIGEVERERWSAGDLAALSAVAELKHTATLVELFDLLRTASVVVGNDSGPGHLAAFAGVRTVSLFGATDSARWSPIGPGVTVLQRTSLEQIAVSEVVGAVIARK